MWTEFKLAAPPGTVEVAGRFDDSCVARIAPHTVEALNSGRLRLRVVQHGGLATIGNASLSIAAVQGSIVVHLGGHGAEVVFGAGTQGSFDLRLWRDTSVRIGDHTTSNGVRIIGDHSDIDIGTDCMFSDSILIQSADQHAIVDLASGRIVNGERRRTVIGHHVWLGRRCMLMPDVALGQGAIVGAGAVVTADVPETCIVAGVPARVVRSAVSWSRSPVALDPAAKALVRRHGTLQALDEPAAGEVVPCDTDISHD